MVENRRRRPTGGRRATIAAVALILGGGGLMAVNVYASATEGGSGPWTSGSVTIDCPDVGNRLTEVPDGAREEVDRQLAELDQQIAAAYSQLQGSAQSVREDAGFADDAVMNPLKEKRAATIARIADAMDRAGDRPDGLDDLAACTLRTADDNAGEQGEQQGDQGQQDQQGQQGNQGGDGGQQQGNGGQAGNGPVAADYADIRSAPSAQFPDPAAGPSTGTFTSSCGVNAGGLFNSDNVIVAPGVSNGAHHFHDYIGNQSNTAFASDDDLADAETSCVDQGDKSTYYWPVLRLQNGTQEKDANSPGGGIEGNAGEIVTPKDVTLTFVGNPRSKVTGMPRLLRIITGDAKAFVNGPANANASWSCTGFEDRELKDKYPLCPAGSDVVRTFRFQSCWDGSNIDSANHRTHVAFEGSDGSCPAGFEAIPQLVQRIVYDVDAPSLADGGRTTPLFAVDSFPENLHKPVTDHGDFINVFDEDLMRQMVDCINEGRTCGQGDDGSGNGGNGPGNGGNDNGGNGNDTPEQPPAQSESPQPSASPESPESPEPSASTAPAAKPADTAPDKGDTGTGAGSGTGSGSDTPAGTETRTDSKPTSDAPKAATPAAQKSSTPDDRNSTSDEEIGTAATAPPERSQSLASPTGSAPGAVIPPVDADTPGSTVPQGVQGSLAETGGVQLWPAVGGGLLVIAGFFVLFRNVCRT